MRGAPPTEAMRSVKALVRELADDVAQKVRPRIRPESSVYRLLQKVYRRIPHPSPAVVDVRPFDLVIREFGCLAPSASFVQIGSNDGVQLDPLREQILARQWSGVMVEPVPYVFRRLEQNYGNYERVRLVNAAIAEQDGVRSFYYLPESDDPGLWEWYHALGSFREDVVRKHVNLIPDIDQRIERTEVRALSFDSLCEGAGLRHVDLIQIDTEGYDWEVIKGIDLDRYQPVLLMFEHLHLDERDKADCYRHLRDCGYELYEDGMDALCLRSEDRDRLPERMRTLWRTIGRDERVRIP